MPSRFRSAAAPAGINEPILPARTEVARCCSAGQGSQIQSAEVYRSDQIEPSPAPERCVT